MENLFQKIISFSKRRGLIFPSSEIYGGFASCYDFGPLGVELKNNIKKSWWQEMTRKHDNIVGIDAAILMSPRVWEASGHLTAGFADKLVECKKCHHRFRKDFLKGSKCPDCGGELTKPKDFNLMMKTFAGPVEDEASKTYLRAETCQGIYVNFQNVATSMRKKIPFGIAQIGKVFRNEITPKNFIYRVREFEQMEMQWFCSPKEAPKFFNYWKKERMNWYLSLGLEKKNLRFREVGREELAHYAKRAVDIEYKFPFGWKEIEGIHNRGDWDLSNHSRSSGEDLSYTDETTGKKYFPHIIETSVGVDRSLFAFLCDAYREIRGGRAKTTESSKKIEPVLSIHGELAPVKVLVLPLVRNKPEVVKKAKEVYQDIKPRFSSQYDETGSVGRRYRRGDEIGVVVSVTCDFQTLEDNTVTLRDRDTMKQVRVEASSLEEIIGKVLTGKDFSELGKSVK